MSTPPCVIVLNDPDPCLINPLPIIGITIGILTLRPLKGAGLLMRDLHWEA